MTEATEWILEMTPYSDTYQGVVAEADTQIQHLHFMIDILGKQIDGSFDLLKYQEELAALEDFKMCILASYGTDEEKLAAGIKIS